VGYGQIRPITPGHFLADTTQGMVTVIKEIYGKNLIGKSIFDIELANEMFDLRLAGNSCSRAALDIALHDAVGKALKVPIHKLFGGASQPRIPLEWSVSLANDVETIVKEAKRAVEEFGIKVLCIKAADHRGWKQDVKHFEAVRRAVGDDVVIGIDPNTGWTVGDSLLAIHAMRQYDLGYIEQPIDRRDLAGLAEIRRQAQGIPVMADEALFTVQDAFALAEARAVDAFCIKLYKLGGFTPARKIAGVAQAANIQLNCGGLAVQCQLEAAASAHYYASYPVKRMMGAAEFVMGLNTIGPDPIVPVTDFVVKDGHVNVPTAPGLGITVDEAALKKHTLLHEVVS
jgi:muconate cycloisomerase